MCILLVQKRYKHCFPNHRRASRKVIICGFLFVVFVSKKVVVMAIFKSGFF